MRKEEFYVLNSLYNGSIGRAGCTYDVEATKALNDTDIYNKLVKTGYIEKESGSITKTGLEALEPYRVNNAVILAAGASTRFIPLSLEQPKGLFEVKGERLIERQIKQLQDAGIKNITVVLGYKKEMFYYLEDKYGVTFEYTGYVRPQILENEYMTAIPKGGNELTDTVTVTRQDDGTLKDDYPNIVVRPYFEQMITDYVEDYFGSDDIRVFSTVTKTSINDLTIITEETISGNISGRSTVFISKDLGSKEEMIKFANDYCIWLKKHDISCDSQVMLLYNPDISKINRINYSDYFGKEYIKIRLMCYVEKNGEIKIEERQVR